MFERDGIKKIQVPVDMQELCAAFEDTSGENRHYLDLETGEIIFIPDDRDTEEYEDLDEMVDDGFGARGCLKCNNMEDFKERYFVISRCPDSEEEERWLDKTLEKQYGVKEYGIAAGVFRDSKGIIESAVCGKCGEARQVLTKILEAYPDDTEIISSCKSSHLQNGKNVVYA